MRCNEMERKRLTVSETLRFANHDFLNELQIISMNLQLGKVEEAKNYIDRISEGCQKNSSLHKLSLPLLAEWLLTVKWRYPEFHFTISNESLSKIELHEDVDMQFVRYLEETMIQLESKIDPFVSQSVHIRIQASDEAMKLQVELQGKWNEPLELPQGTPYFHAVEISNEDNKKYVYDLSVTPYYLCAVNRKPSS